MSELATILSADIRFILYPAIMTGGKHTRSTSSSEDLNEKLINKVCATFLDQMKAEFDRRFNKLENKLTEMNGNLLYRPSTQIFKKIQNPLSL